MLAEQRRWYGTTGGTVVPNCRRTDWVRPVAKEPLVVGAGRVWDPAKNLSALAALAPQLDCPTQIAGDPWLPWPQLAELLLRAAVYVAPARYEPFGLGPLEAALAGCALVLGDIPSLREVWGQAAAWVDPDDPAALRAAVHGLITDPAQRAELSQRARRRAERYRPTRTAAGYLQVYRAAAAARTTPGVSA
jgi:glycosyltransferase involved in cell wall biosynthesis